MFGTNRQFSLDRLPFSREGAFLSVYEDNKDNNLYLTICRGNGVMLDRASLMKLTPCCEDGDLKYTYDCDGAKLIVLTNRGTVEFTYEDPQIMRVRTTGISLRIDYEPQMHEGAAERDWGEVEVAFSDLGKLLFKQISGKMTNTVAWYFREVRPYPFEILLSPGEDRQTAELAIHEYMSSGVAKAEYMPFDKAYEQNLEDFNRFCSYYGQVAPAYREMAKKAAYMVWSSILGPRGSIKKPAAYMHKLYLARAFGWQQCFHAMALKNNVKKAWDFLLTMFEYQDELGGIPDHISDRNQTTWISTKPPLFGFAVIYILDNYDISALTTEDYEELYIKLSRYTNWWFTHHDHSHSGYPAYYHPDESGYDEATLFEKGLPLHAPDLEAYIVMLCEACSRLAALTDRRAEADKWLSESKRVLNYLVNELWDGEQFCAKVLATGEKYKCGSVAQLQPVMLGSRLPAEIIKKIAERLLNPEEFLTDFGIASENLNSDKLMMRSFTRGPVVAPAQMLIISGLYEGGEKEAARFLAARYLNALNCRGLALGIHPYKYEPVSGDEIKAFNSGQSVGFPFSSWVGSVYLALAQNVLGEA